MATSTDDISLLFRIRADAAGVKTATSEAKAAVAQLRQSFGPELAQTVSISNKTFSDLANNLSQFVGQRIPLVGGAFTRLTDNIKGMGAVSAGSEKALASVGKSIESIATASGKTVPQIASFLTGFVKLETQAKRDASAIDFFGASVATKLLPQLEKAGTELATVAAASEGAGAGIAALAGPVGIAVVAIAALVVGVALVSKELFTLSKNAAEFQGKMFDLAQQTGLAVSTLSALEALAKTTGGELGTITQAVVLFQRKLDDAQDPLSKTAELFRKFNVDTSDTETSLRSAFSALAAMPEGFAQTNAAAELFGARGGKQVLAILKETNGDIDGTIKRLRDMGILISEDAARAADKFNDELVLLELQLRGLTAAAAEDLIPAMVEIIGAFGDMVTAVRPLVSTLSSIAGVALRPVAEAFKGLSLIVQALTFDYKGLTKAIKESRDAQNIPALKVPEVTPVPLPGAPTPRQTASNAVNEADAVVAATRRSVVAQRQALDELFQKGRKSRETQADETIGANERVLKAEKQGIDARLALKEQEIKALDEAQRKRGEIPTRDTEQFRAITAEIGKLQQERLDKENDFAVESKRIRAKVAKEQQDDEIQHQEELLRRTKELDAARIAQIQATAGRQLEADTAARKISSTAALDAEKQIEAIENTALDREQAFLVRKIAILGSESPERQNIADQIAAIEQRRTALAQEQAERRIQIARDEAQRLSEIAQGLIDDQLNKASTAITLGEISDRSRIATTQSLATLRVKTEEQAAKEILQIRLDAIEREKDFAAIEREAINAANQAQIQSLRNQRSALDEELNKAGAVADPAERVRKQAAIRQQQQAFVDLEIAAALKANKDKEDAERDHNNKVEILNAERAEIEAQGARDIEAGRQQDVQNEKRYSDELLRIKERILNIQREAARFIVESLVLRGASRNRVARAQLEFDRQDEADRHSQALQALSAQRRDILESNRTQEEKAEALKELHRLIEAENDRHENENRLHILRMISSRAFTRAKILEQIRLDAEVEEKRHKKAVEDLKREQEDLDKSTAIGEEKLRRQKDLNRRTEEENKRHEEAKTKQKDDEKTTKEKTGPLENFRLGKDEIEDFAKSLEESIVPLNEILANSFLQVADAIGQTVANWVLLGETGPAVMRKILAQALASIAAEAAVNAIKELALGFATLFFNPAESVAHFTAAGLWAAIGGVAAVAGRSLAGDLFKPKSGTGAGSSTSQGNGQLNPLNLARNAGPGSQQQIAPQIQPLRIQISVNDSKFGKAITAHVVDDFNSAGPIREVIGGDGNLNRG